MKVVYADEFVQRFRKLPLDAQRLFRHQEALFRKDWRDARLHAKRLEGQPVTFSFRITRRYRVIFVFIDHETTLFATIGHRRDVYR